MPFVSISIRRPRLFIALTNGDNTNIINQWMADHGGKAMPNRVKKSMATCKSAMRSALRGGPGKKGRRKKGVVLAAAPRASIPGLEKLDEMIDLCVGAARVLNVAGIEPVLKHLRVAQAHIVLLFDDNR